MNPLQKLQSRFRALFGKRQLDAEMDEEMRSHVELRTQANIEAGMNPEEARFAALREFGWSDSIKEKCREQRGVNLVENVWRDVRFSLRQLIKNPGFAMVAVLTLALCLGANLSIFAVIDSILLKSLPFPNADRLVTMFNSYPKIGHERGESSFLNYFSRRGKIDAFSSIAAFNRGSAITGETGSTEKTAISRVSPEFFTTLGVAPVMGRAFTDEEMTSRSDAVVILTDSLWRRDFNADPAVLGRSLRVDGVLKTVVGVLPSNFRFLSDRSRLFLPLTSESDQRRIENLHNGGIEMIGRLKPDATLSEAQAEIDAHNAVMNREFPYAKQITETGFRTVVARLHAEHVSSIRPTLWLLQAGVFCLLLIGCVNLLNLLLIRASSRAQEFAIRQSLGAGRVHLARQVLTETLMLAFLGGATGFAFATAGVRILGALGIDRLPLGSQVKVNPSLAAAGLLGTIAVGVIVALPVLWLVIRTGPNAAVHGAARTGTASHAAQRLRHGFMVTQVALAFTLLAGAGLLGVSLHRAMMISPGFRPQHILAGQISLPLTNYRDEVARLEFTDRLLDAVRSQRGVEACGIITDIPVNGTDDFNVMRIPGHEPELATPPILHYRYGVSGDYFSAMGIPLREGRFLENADSHRSLRVCVVDEDFAHTYWPGQSALGKHVSEGPDRRDESQWFTIVGVVGAIKQTHLTDRTPGRAIYFPYRYNADGSVFVAIHTGLPPESFEPTFRKLVRTVDPELPVDDLRPMEVRITDSLVVRRSPALLAVIFAGVAMLLAAIGTYGVLSYAVAQRRREIGVRMALGALPAQIARQFLSLGLRLVAVGVVLGIAGAWLAGRAMQGLLYDVPAFDPATLVVTGLLLGAVSVFACLLPVLRASRLNPMEALRNE